MKIIFKVLLENYKIYHFQHSDLTALGRINDWEISEKEGERSKSHPQMSKAFMHLERDA